MKNLTISGAVILLWVFLLTSGCGEKHCSQEFVSDNNAVAFDFKLISNFSTKADFQKALDKCKAFVNKHGDKYACVAQDSDSRQEKTINVSEIKSKCDELQDKLNKLP